MYGWSRHCCTSGRLVGLNWRSALVSATASGGASVIRAPMSRGRSTCGGVGGVSCGISTWKG
eukprot:scaffold12364_cov118-Isochrysis_galbana.AAC.1